MKRRTFLQTAGISVAAATLPATLNAQPPKIRRALSTLNPGDPVLVDYANAIAAMNGLPDDDPRSWVAQSRIHADSCPHGEAGFLPWHRHYLCFFERICAELIKKPDFALPYWDWTENGGRLPFDFFDDNPLNIEHLNNPGGYVAPRLGFPIGTDPVRGISVNYGLSDDPIRGGSFSAASIARITGLGNYNLFSRRLEGVHGNAHVVTGAGNGHMGDYLSPLDPAFWLHHCMVDQLWAAWQAAGNTTSQLNEDYTGHFVDESGNVTNAPASAVMSIGQCGYSYDTLSRELLSATDRVLLESLESRGIIGMPPDVITAIESIGDSGAVGIAAAMDVETRIPVGVDNLFELLDNSRTFRPTKVPFIQRVSQESGRVLAEITVTNEQGDMKGAMVNVFLNCGYLSPQTPYTDPHYADSFSFFGQSMGERSILVDITAPLRQQALEGRLTGILDVQVMPVAIASSNGEEPNFTVQSVRLISV